MKDTAWPRWRYHKTLRPDGKIVRSFEENEELGLGWVDSPAQFDLEPEVPADPPAGSTSEAPVPSGEMSEGSSEKAPEAPPAEPQDETKPEVPARGRGGRKKKSEN